MDKNTLAYITRQISTLNKALGNHRGTPRVTADRATPAQRPLLAELAAWEDAHQQRLTMDSACARAEILAEARQANPATAHPATGTPLAGLYQS